MADPKTIGDWTETVTDLPPNKRYICTHDKDGKSVVHSSPPQLYHGRGGVGGMARSCISPFPIPIPIPKSMWHSLVTVSPTPSTPRTVCRYLTTTVATATIPATLANDADVSAYLSSTGATSHLGTDIIVPTQRGANLVVVDMAPGGQSQMHRTVSIDFSICVIGYVRMELDGGEMLDLRPGVSRTIAYMEVVELGNVEGYGDMSSGSAADSDTGPYYPARNDAQVV